MGRLVKRSYSKSMSIWRISGAILGLALGVLVSDLGAMDNDSDGRIREKIETETVWELARAQSEQEWTRAERAQQEEWQRTRAEIERIWDSVIFSTKKEWVEYDTQHTARSMVDFEHGTIVFEAIGPNDDPKIRERAIGQIVDRAREVFGQEDLAGEKVLENQIIADNGAPITERNLDQYLKEEVLPAVKPEAVPFQALDGRMRKKFSVQVNMVPDHIRRRAAKYLPLVRKNAAHFGIDPHLIMAIIHTESFFNPRAVSPENAAGIMQIVPDQAGREAFRFIHAQDQPPTQEYLFNPANNIELGVAYLHLLRFQYFKDITDDLKNRYVCICGYNWGPTSLRRQIVSPYPITTMSDDEVYTLLRRETPPETREYLRNVVERTARYASFS